MALSYAPSTINQVSEKCMLPISNTCVMMAGLISSNIAEYRDGIYYLTPKGTRIVRHIHNIFIKSYDAVPGNNKLLTALQEKP